MTQKQFKAFAVTLMFFFLVFVGYDIYSDLQFEKEMAEYEKRSAIKEKQIERAHIEIDSLLTVEIVRKLRNKKRIDSVYIKSKKLKIWKKNTE